jgi:hypothetical protein
MKYLLVVLLPDKTEKKIALEGDKVTLGRSSGNAIQLSVPEISSRHLEFTKLEDGYQVLDVGSTNGTKVNGARIREHQLQDGDRLLIGQVLRAEYRAVDDEATTARDAAPPKPEVVEVAPEPAAPTVLMEKPPPVAKPAEAIPAAPAVPKKPPPAAPKIPRPAKATQTPPPANPDAPAKPPVAPPSGPNVPTVRKLKPPGGQ